MRQFSQLILFLICVVTVGCTGIPASLPPAEQSPTSFSLTIQVTGGSGSVSSSPAGLACSGSTCSGTFTSGTAVTLTPVAQQNLSFTGWSGACSGTAACTVTMTGPQTATATFAAQASSFPLQVQLSGSGAGSVSSNPAGIDCGSTCSASFPQGTTVALTANAAAGSTFSGWSGACSGAGACTVTTDSAQNVTANFATQVQFQLQVQLSGTGAGAVNSTPGGINCGPTCNASFPAGTQVTLMAAAIAGSQFQGWSGACIGEDACTVTMNSNLTVTAEFKGISTEGISSVNHIIFMLLENRSFDHYFGRLNDYRAKMGLPQDVDDLVMYQKTHGGDLPSNPCRQGASCGFNGEDTVTSFHLISMCVENPSPSWNESHVDWNQQHPTSQTPLLNGFVWEAAGDAIGSGYHDTDGRRAMGYYDGDDLPYYYFMATEFATSDRWFSPALTRTHPNRMYSMAATSQGHAYPIPEGGKQLTAKTIFQLLDEHGVTWKVYSGTGSYFKMFTYANSHEDHIVPVANFLTDAQNGTLPQVAFIEPGEDVDEHPGVNPDQPGPDIQYDAQSTSTMLNAFMASPSWKDSVFILSFDEAGGFYDHVPPMAAKNPDGIKPQDLRDGDICTKGETNPSNCNFDRTGYRLPLMVISPFTKPHYVSHTPMDYTAVLKFIETRFNLPSLTARDAAQPDMTEFFDFQNVPWATPPTPPVQPVKSGVCYNDHLP